MPRAAAGVSPSTRSVFGTGGPRTSHWGRFLWTECGCPGSRTSSPEPPSPSGRTGTCPHAPCTTPVGARSGPYDTNSDRPDHRGLLFRVLPTLREDLGFIGLLDPSPLVLRVLPGGHLYVGTSSLLRPARDGGCRVRVPVSIRLTKTPVSVLAGSTHVPHQRCTRGPCSSERAGRTVVDTPVVPGLSPVLGYPSRYPGRDPSRPGSLGGTRCPKTETPPVPGRDNCGRPGVVAGRLGTRPVPLLPCPCDTPVPGVDRDPNDLFLHPAASTPR